MMVDLLSLLLRNTRTWAAQALARYVGVERAGRGCVLLRGVAGVRCQLIASARSRRLGSAARVPRFGLQLNTTAQAMIMGCECFQWIRLIGQYTSAMLHTKALLDG
jgi:hypothetical protein